MVPVSVLEIICPYIFVVSSPSPFRYVVASLVGIVEALYREILGIPPRFVQPITLSVINGEHLRPVLVAVYVKAKPARVVVSVLLHHFHIIDYVTSTIFPVNSAVISVTSISHVRNISVTFR